MERSSQVPFYSMEIQKFDFLSKKNKIEFWIVWIAEITLALSISVLH